MVRQRCEDANRVEDMRSCGSCEIAFVVCGAGGRGGGGGGGGGRRWVAVGCGGLWRVVWVVVVRLLLLLLGREGGGHDRAVA